MGISLANNPAHHLLCFLCMDSMIGYRQLQGQFEIWCLKPGESDPQNTSTCVES
jgi:hypothetical protein